MGLSSHARILQYLSQWNFLPICCVCGFVFHVPTSISSVALTGTMHCFSLEFFFLNIRHIAAEAIIFVKVAILLAMLIWAHGMQCTRIIWRLFCLSPAGFIIGPLSQSQLSDLLSAAFIISSPVIAILARVLVSHEYCKRLSHNHHLDNVFVDFCGLWLENNNTCLYQYQYYLHILRYHRASVSTHSTWLMPFEIDTTPNVHKQSVCYGNMSFASIYL